MKAINLGFKYTDTEWLVILNDDIEFKVQNSKFKIQNDNKKFKMRKNKKEIFDYLIDYAVKNKLEAVTPVLRNPDGSIENLGYKVLTYGKIDLVKELTGWRVGELNNKNQKSKCKMQNEKRKYFRFRRDYSSLSSY